MINKIITYTCNVIENGQNIEYTLTPNNSIFQIGKLHYYISEQGFILRLYDDSFSSYFLQDDFKVERVCLLNKKQYLFLRKVYKILKCKFRFTYYNHSITFKDCKGDELMIVKGIIDLFDNIVCCNIDLLESEGVFNVFL